MNIRWVFVFVIKRWHPMSYVLFWTGQNRTMQSFWESFLQYQCMKYHNNDLHIMQYNAIWQFDRAIWRSLTWSTGRHFSDSDCRNLELRFRLESVQKIVFGRVLSAHCLGRACLLLLGACARPKVDPATQFGRGLPTGHNQTRMGAQPLRGEKPEKQHLVIFGKIGERVRENCLAKTFWWHLWSCWRRGFCYSHGFTWWRPGCALGGAQMTISDSGNCYFTTKPSRTLVQLSNLDLTWVSRSEQLEPKQAWIFLQI